MANLDDGSRKRPSGINVAGDRLRMCAVLLYKYYVGPNRSEIESEKKPKTDRRVMILYCYLDADETVESRRASDIALGNVGGGGSTGVLRIPSTAAHLMHV